MMDNFDFCDYNYVKSRLGGVAQSIAKTTLGRDILVVVQGHGGVLFQGAIHAREHITAYITLELALYNLKHKVLKNATFVPMVNPDGVDICIHGLDSVANSDYRQMLLNVNGESSDFLLWKANASAVDLNLNFDADWGLGKGNITQKAPKGYIGAFPFSEVETRCLRDLTIQNDYRITFSFHAKGEELYYGYNNIDLNPLLTTQIAKTLGYTAKQTTQSTGGYKDWCVLKRHIPAYTIEFGSDYKTYSDLYGDRHKLLQKAIALLKMVAQYE